MFDLGVGSWIERRARSDPDAPALVFGDRTTSYSALAGRIRRLAAALQSLGVQRADRVCYLGPNHPALLETLFATARLGAILAPVNHRAEVVQIRSVLADCAPAVVVIDASLTHLVPESPGETRIVVGATGDGGRNQFEDLIAAAPNQSIDTVVSMDDVCLLPHTSGTTGRPKGVMLTHANVTWNAINLVTSTDLRARDVTIALAPFFRVGGTGVNVLPGLFQGGTVVVPTAEETTPLGILRLLERHRVTVGFGNPDLLASLVDSPGWRSADLSSLRYVITGGAPVPERLLTAFLERGVPCLQGYGLSEAAPFVLILPPEHALDRIGAAGRPALFVDTRVVRPDGGHCAPGETGELVVRGPNIMAGYWRLPEATRQVIGPDGWLHTGDAARIDGDGFVWIVDRVRDAFQTVGGLVYPADIDRVVLEHPGVVDAASVGVPTDSGDWVPHVFVVPAPGHPLTGGDIIAFCRGRLPAYAVPAVATFVNAVPRNSVGKLLRQELARSAGHRSG